MFLCSVASNELFINKKKDVCLLCYTFRVMQMTKSVNNHFFKTGIIFFIYC